MRINELAAKKAIEIANDNSFGYSNSYPYNRFGVDSTPKDGDCGGFVSYIYALMGIIPMGEYYEPTGNKTPWNEAMLLKYFDKLDYSERNKVGDILTSNGHTEMVATVKETNGRSCDQLVGARDDYDGVSGDSSGNEIAVCDYFEASGGWNWIYRLKDELNVEVSDHSDGLQNSAESDGKWAYYKDGKIDTTVTTVCRNTNGWWYVKNGYVDFTYTGLADNSNGTWYIEKGKVNFGKTDVLECSYNGVKAWWNLVKGKLTPNTVAHNNNGWWYIDSNGKVDFTFNGAAKNENGLWYIKNGKVDFTASGSKTVNLTFKGGKAVI